MVVMQQAKHTSSLGPSPALATALKMACSSDRENRSSGMLPNTRASANTFCVQMLTARQNSMRRGYMSAKHLSNATQWHECERSRTELKARRSSRHQAGTVRRAVVAQCELRGPHLIAALVAAAVHQVRHGAGQLRDLDVLQPRLRRRRTPEGCAEGAAEVVGKSSTSDRMGRLIQSQAVSHAYSRHHRSTCDHPFRRVRNGNKAARASLSSSCTSTRSAVLSPLSATGTEPAETAVVILCSGSGALWQMHC